MTGRIAALLVAVTGLTVGCGAAPATAPPPVVETTAPKPAAKTTPPVPTTTTKPVPAKTLTFSLARYPNVADHIRDAIADGESAVCTLDRDGADDRRADAVVGHATAKGKDRDEYPFAICTEGGTGADIRLVPSGENRSAGAWMGNKLERWPDGTRVLVVVGK